MRIDEMVNQKANDVIDYFNGLLMNLVEKRIGRVTPKDGAPYDMAYEPFSISEDLCGITSQCPLGYMDSDKIMDAFEKACKDEGLNGDDDGAYFTCHNDINLIIDDDDNDDRGYKIDGTYKVNEISSVTIKVQSTLMDEDGITEYVTDDFFEKQVVFDQPAIVADGSPFLSKNDERKLIAVMQEAIEAMFGHYN